MALHPEQEKFFKGIPPVEKKKLNPWQVIGLLVGGVVIAMVIVFAIAHFIFK